MVYIYILRDFNASMMFYNVYICVLVWLCLIFIVVVQAEL